MNKYLTNMLAIIIVLAAFSSARGADMAENPIEACPDSPNCVSSLEVGQDSFIEPIRYEGSVEAAVQRLKTILKRHENATIIDSNSRVIRAEFRTSVFGFVDDVVFFADENEQVIHMRSASRVGYWDFGVNRKRLETIRKSFQNDAQSDKK